MDYLRAAFRHFYFLVAGVIGVALTVAGLVLPAYAPVIGIALLVVAVFVGQYKAWQEMRAERDKEREEAARLRAQLETREKRKAIREAVGRFITQGEEIKTWLEQAGVIVLKNFNERTGSYGVEAPADTFKSSLRGSLDRATEWDEQVYAYLVAHVGGSYAARFRSRSETTERPKPNLWPKRHLPAWERVDRGLQILSDILKEAGEDLIGT